MHNQQSELWSVELGYFLTHIYQNKKLVKIEAPMAAKYALNWEKFSSSCTVELGWMP